MHRMVIPQVLLSGFLLFASAFAQEYQCINRSEVVITTAAPEVAAEICLAAPVMIMSPMAAMTVAVI